MFMEILIFQKNEKNGTMMPEKYQKHQKHRLQ